MKIFLDGRLAGTITWEVSPELTQKLFGECAPQEMRHNEQVLQLVLQQVGERFFQALLSAFEKPPREVAFSLQHLGMHLRQFPHNGASQASQMGDD